MPEPEMVLVMAAATTFVGAMATSVWQDIRSGIVDLFRRASSVQHAAITAQLDSHAALVAQSEDSERARHYLVPVWQLQLEDLLRKNPDAEAELRTLVERAGSLLPADQRAWVQTNIARDGGQVFAAQGGSVIIHHGSPEQVQPGALTDREPDSTKRRELSLSGKWLNATVADLYVLRALGGSHARSLSLNPPTL